jgi:transcriptional regulator GlxA family with amidase domain
LALVEADLGAATANLIARHFVLYARRPGYQSQFSPLLQAQAAATRRSPR